MENYISIIVGSSPAFSCFINAHFVDKRLFSGLYSRFARSHHTHASSNVSKDIYSSESKLPIISTPRKHSNVQAENGYIALDVMPNKQTGIKIRDNTTP